VIVGAFLPTLLAYKHEANPGGYSQQLGSFAKETAADLCSANVLLERRHG